MTTTQGTKMRALVQDEYGSTDVLRMADVAVPEISDEQVLIRVHAASINPLDWHIMRGSPAGKPMLSASPVQRPRLSATRMFGGTSATPACSAAMLDDESA